MSTPLKMRAGSSARGAIRQIKDKKYVRALAGYEGKILLVGINYDKKTKKYKCSIDPM